MSTVTVEHFGSLMRVNARRFEEAAATGSLFRLYFVLLRTWTKSGFAVRKSRAFLKNAAQAAAPEALRAEYRAVAAVRDRLLALHRNRRDAPALGPAYGIILRMLDSWDELAEDWAFASDPEIGALLDAVAAKL